MKILVFQDIDGVPGVRECLEKRGHEMMTCADIAQGKDLWRRTNFPLVVLSLTRLETSADLCRWIRHQPTGGRSFIVVMIRVGSSASAAAFFKAGADDVWPSTQTPGDLELRVLALERQVARSQDWLRLEEVLQTRSQQQVAIAALGHAAFSEEIGTVAELASRFIVEILQVEISGIFEIKAGEKALRCNAGLGWKGGMLGGTMPIEAGGWFYRTSQGEDVVSDPKRDETCGQPDSFLVEHHVTSGISAAIKGQSGIVGAVGAYAVEPRKFNEDDLHFLRGIANVLGEALERKSKELEIQKHQQQVQHLQRLESVGQLAAGIAHDYNNVLTIIHGHVTLVLSDAGLPTSSARSLKTALDAVERAAGLTRQLLTFSRKQSMQAELVDLDTVVGNVSKLLGRVLGENVSLKVKKATDSVTVEADPGMLEQVLMNLAVNARDAMVHGGTVTFSTSVLHVPPSALERHPEARPGEFVCLDATDTGCGMDDATQRRIFEPFFTTKEPGKGTGLGLATVYGIVKQHQGWVEVQSQVGVGTTFRIYLPRVHKPVAAKGSVAVATPVPRGTETVLLVEDEVKLRELTRLLLLELGYEVLEASTGLEALRVWAKRRTTIRVLLTDLVMPDALTGFDLAERLQMDCPDLRVVLTSGYEADAYTQALASKLGFRFLKKPFRTETLARTVRDCLDASPERVASS